MAFTMACPNFKKGLKMAFGPLGVNETRIYSLQAHLDLQATLVGKFNDLSCYDGHGIIMLFHNDMKLSKTCTFTDYGTEFITTLFNGNTSSPMNIITTYKPPKMKICNYLVILQSNLETVPTDCSTFILGDLTPKGLRGVFSKKHSKTAISSSRSPTEFFFILLHF
jgi:hypothetical protein